MRCSQRAVYTWRQMLVTWRELPLLYPGQFSTTQLCTPAMLFGKADRAISYSKHMSERGGKCKTFNSMCDKQSVTDYTTLSRQLEVVL